MSNTPAGQAVVDEGVYITHHTLQRMLQVYDRVGFTGARNILSRATELDRDLVAALLARSSSACLDRYLLCDEQQGIFVVCENEPDRRGRWFVKTFLRLGDAQRRVLAGGPAYDTA